MKDISNRISPSATASSILPLLVSNAIAVVITLVKWLIFPPTIITAPTSALALPNPVRATVMRAYLDS